MNITHLAHARLLAFQSFFSQKQHLVTKHEACRRIYRPGFGVSDIVLHILVRKAVVLISVLKAVVTWILLF